MITLVFLAGLALTGQAPAQESSGTTDYDVPPKILKQKKPSYPYDAFRKRTEGIVFVEFVVDERGQVKNPRVLKSVPGLDEAAIKAVQKWRFIPAQKNGKPVRTTAQGPVTFCIFEEGCRALRAKQQEK